MINYLCTAPLPKVDSTDAVYNEIELLRKTFGGQVSSIYPFKSPTSLFPNAALGWTRLNVIKKMEKAASMNHVFVGRITWIPFLNILAKPTILTVMTGIDPELKLPTARYLNQFKKIVVSSNQDKAKLNDFGVKNVEVIRTCIDISNLERLDLKLALSSDLHLLMASAPWELSQFKSKGIHLILDVLKTMPNVRMTLLWRGHHFEEMTRLVKNQKLENQVNIINQFTNVNDILKKVHGCILLVNSRSIVKSYPHSLIESIVCGKPVILTESIPMSDFVSEAKCGLVLRDFDSKSLNELFQKFIANYDDLFESTQNVPRSEFSHEKMIDRYGKIYKDVLGSESLMSDE